MDFAYGSDSNYELTKKLNGFAMDTYEEWLTKRALRPISWDRQIVEWLFHAIQTDNPQLEQLRSKLHGFIELFAGDFYDAVKGGVIGIIEGDNEILYLLEKRIGVMDFTELFDS